MEEAPVVRFIDAGPYRLHLIDMHRAGKIALPIGVIQRAVGSVARELIRQGSEGGVIIATATRSAAPPIEKEAVDFHTAFIKRGDDRLSERRILFRIDRQNAEPFDQRTIEGAAEEVRIGFKFGHEDLGFRQRAEGDRELDDIPVNCLGLPCEGVKPRVVEIGGGETRLPLGGETPGAVIEALPGDVDIVAVEHSMDEACGHIGRREARGALHNVTKQADRCVLSIRFFVIMLERVCEQPLQTLDIADSREALKAADADMAMAEADQHGGPGGGGLVTAFQRFAGLDQREAFRSLDAQRLQHFGGQHLADPALQRQAAVAEAAIGRLSRALGAEIEQATRIVAKLRKQETPPVPDIGIVYAKLMAVIAQRQWLRKIIGQRLETAEMGDPLRVVELGEPNRVLPAIVAESQYVAGEYCRLHGFCDEIGDTAYRRIRSIIGWLRDCGHTAIWRPLLKGATMTAWSDGYWWSNDALRLHYRDYAGRADRPPILCLPGLTRNARDFADLAERLSGEWRVICPDLRGRGESAYAKDPMTYVPLVYLQDLEALIAGLGLTRIVLVGTSLGGLLTMLLGGTGNAQIAGAVLNDIGPDLETKGLDRIRSYVGRQSSWPTWLHAARAIAEHNRDIYPDYTLQAWIDMAKRLCRLTQAGRIVYDYDMKIAEPFRLPGGEAGVDLWPAFDSLNRVPMVVVRGALSDILSDKTAIAMAKRHRGLDYVTVPRVGHAPTLNEPEAVAAIERLLAKVVG